MSCVQVHFGSALRHLDVHMPFSLPVCVNVVLSPLSCDNQMSLSQEKICPSRCIVFSYLQYPLPHECVVRSMAERLEIPQPSVMKDLIILVVQLFSLALFHLQQR